MIPREHFKADGKAKRAYPSERAALAVLDSRQEDRHRLTAYLCTLCGAWHLGKV